MKKKYFIYKLFIIAGLTTAMVSCENTFDIKPKDVLEADQVYQSLSDADAAVYGVYGKFMKLADQYVILNELRGDLLDVTSRSNPALKEINNHQVSKGNPYANPRAFYEVIVACNDVLERLDQMLAEGKIGKVDRDERVSDIGSLRTWVYLQLGIHYGNVPYLTKPLRNLNDLKDTSLFPRLSFDELLTQLIEYANSLPVQTQYAAGTSTITLPNGSNVFIDGVQVSKIFITRKLILGDLYLWKNNYVEAAKRYRDILNDVPRDAAVTPQGNRGSLTVSYSVYNYSDWRNMFSDAFASNGNSTSSAGYNWEWIWSIPFHKDFAPNPFIKLFSNTNGEYQLKPSQQAMNNWQNETREDGTPFDLRGLNASYSIIQGEPVVRKFLARYSADVPLEKTGIWYLNRAAGLHMRMAEAANRDNKHRLAYALLSYEIKNLFDPVQKGLIYSRYTGGRNSDSDWPNSSNKRDLRKIQKTPWEYPFDFDAAERTFPGQVRGQYANHMGIRRRVGAKILTIDSLKYFDMSAAPNSRFVNVETLLLERPITDSKGLMEDMEDKILQEGALETAFEGQRWQDLLRIALRRNDPAVLAKRVAAKFRAKGDNATADAVEQKLMNMQNWYLPFDIP